MMPSKVSLIINEEYFLDLQIIVEVSPTTEQIPVGCEISGIVTKG